MESENNDILVATTRPVRGREVVTTRGPTDVFDLMRLASAKRTSRDEALTSDLSKSRTDNVETYYEGYVDGKKYLVPDSNLEAMKDMINLGMRQRRITRFRHQTSADTTDLQMSQERLDKIMAKVRDFSFSMSDDKSGASSKSGKTIKSRESRMSKQWSQVSLLTKEENGSKSKSLKSPSSKLETELRSESLEYPSPTDDFSLPESFLLSTEKIVSSEYNSKEQQSVFEKEKEESDNCYLRLVLSGHYKKNEKPIYIIQEYSAKSNLFCKQSADFTSSQTQGNVHISMVGKHFYENILEETDGKPTSLNLKPIKIMIDANKCKIFDSYFKSTYSRRSVDITIKGEFLPNERSMNITPYLSITVKHNNNMNVHLSDFSSDKKSEGKRPSIVVKNRQSLISSSTEISKDTKRFSFKESSDDKELYIIYKNTRKQKPDDSLPSKVICSKKEGHLKTRLNENEESKGHTQIVAKRPKVLERMLYLVTKKNLFKKLFGKRKW